ncbi:hypothetical protein MMC24_000904 [Lignoscripta atroalba]|nr:hypothetical protein [Lignoscripta atroalba]
MQDSPLAITASIAGILTFVYALVAGTLGYLYLFQDFNNSDEDIERFYEAFSACALETDIVRQDILMARQTLQNRQSETKGYVDPDPLARLFEQVRAVEVELQVQAAKIMKPTPSYNVFERLIGRGRWMSRSKELGVSLRKREALTARLLVIQLSLFSEKLHSQATVVSELKSEIRVNQVELATLRGRLDGYAQSPESDTEKALHGC